MPDPRVGRPLGRSRPRLLRRAVRRGHGAAARRFHGAGRHRYLERDHPSRAGRVACPHRRRRRRCATPHRAQPPRRHATAAHRPWTGAATAPGDDSGGTPRRAPRLRGRRARAVGDPWRSARALAGLHPPLLSRLGLGRSVQALARRSPIPVRVDVELPGRPAPSVETATYYVISEALTNAIKIDSPPCGGTRISIELSVDDPSRR